MISNKTEAGPETVGGLGSGAGPAWDRVWAQWVLWKGVFSSEPLKEL